MLKRICFLLLLVVTALSSSPASAGITKSGTHAHCVLFITFKNDIRGLNNCGTAITMYWDWSDSYHYNCQRRLAPREIFIIGAPLYNDHDFCFISSPRHKKHNCRYNNFFTRKC